MSEAPSICETCNCYPCACGGERKTMGDKWQDDPRIRAILGHQLRAHVAYQSGENSAAPSVIYADADYEVGDGTCGLWPDGKQANEPAIVYARVDIVLHLTARVAELEAALLTCEVEASYTPHNPACEKVIKAARAALGKGK